MNDILLQAEGLQKTFSNGVRAVDDVSLYVRRGETLGVVGESGCGKSTTAKILLRLLKPDAGSVTFNGVNLLGAGGKTLRKLREKLQVVPQNPQTSLNPRLTISASIEFNLRAQGWQRSDRRRRVSELLDRVGLVSSYGGRFPHEMSGGQLQRAAIARALATRPDIVICDEAVSALDKSVQAQVLNLLTDLQRDLGIAYLFISHDLGVVEHLSDRVAVMYLGRIVEEGPAQSLWAKPLHPYTEALLSASPGASRERVVLQGDLPNPADPPTGCTFRTRCPIAIPACAEAVPARVETDIGHAVACIRREKAELPALRVG